MTQGEQNFQHQYQNPPQFLQNMAMENKARRGETIESGKFGLCARDNPRSDTSLSAYKLDYEECRDRKVLSLQVDIKFANRYNVCVTNKSFQVDIKVCLSSLYEENKVCTRK